MAVVMLQSILSEMGKVTPAGKVTPVYGTQYMDLVANWAMTQLATEAWRHVVLSHNKLQFMKIQLNLEKVKEIQVNSSLNIFEGAKSDTIVQCIS